MGVHDHEVDDDAWDVVWEVEASVIADFDPSLRTEFLAEFVPAGKRRDSRDEEYWVYL